MSYIKVAKSGYNALTDTNPQHFQFDSSYNTFKLADILSVSLTATGVHVPGQTYLNSNGYISQTVSPPSSVSGYTPYFFTFISETSIYNGNATGYDFVQDPNSQTDGFVIQNSSLDFVVGLYYVEGSGTTDTVTYTFNIYLFANPV